MSKSGLAVEAPSAFRDAANATLYITDPSDDQACLLVKVTAGGGQGNRSRSTLKQLNAEVLFQLTYLPAQRRLAPTDGIGSVV